MTEVLELARVIHIARLESCYIKGPQLDNAMKLQPFPPVGSKELRELLHHGQSWIDIAIDQAKAVLRHQREQDDERLHADLRRCCDCVRRYFHGSN